ncbi:MAG: 2-oxoacid:acceptor oxidoreductase family protein [Anaerolineales bacterium]|jgi:2-oxoglutarate ferredoxin oxidoreductase subunit gamma
MQTEIIISGFGGQGALFAGQLLTYAAVDSGKVVTWIPSYGPEMRGGTAHCTVIVSDEEIGSPLVRQPQAAVVMNLPSLDLYEPRVKSGGVLVVNASMANRQVRRRDIVAVSLPANEIAESLGDLRMANMVMLGALLDRLPILSLEAIQQALDKHLASRHRDLLEQNGKALRLGAERAAIKVLG